MISLCQNTQESTVEPGQEAVSPAPNTVVHLGQCFSLPAAFHVPYAVCLMESSNFMSVPERGKFQLIPGITNLLFPLSGAAPTFLWNFFSGSTSYRSLA